MFRIFTPQEANRALPEVKQMFRSIVSQKDYVVSLQEELQQIESLSSLEKLIKKKQQLNAAVSKLYKLIELLENLGVLIKSVDEGVLDFPSVRFDEDVLLCWKFGETEVRFWHNRDEGFTDRKSLAPAGLRAEESDLAELR
jgi:hypothetical protein